MWKLQKPIYFIAIIAIALFACPTSRVEEKYYGSIAPPHVLKTRIYDDGTVVARIVGKNMMTTTAVCFYEMLSLRIIHPDGLVDEKDIKLDIPLFNHRSFRQQNEKIEFLDYYLITKNHILISCYNPNNVDTYEGWEMIINFNGKKFDEACFETAFIDTRTYQLVPDRNSYIKRFLEPEPTNIDEVVHNNTLLVAQIGTNNSWIDL